MRPTPTSFLEKIGIELDALESSQNDPPLMIVRRFEKKYGPLHRVLYGEDIVELTKIEIQANKFFDKLKARVSNNSSLDVSSVDNIVDNKRLPSIDEQRPCVSATLSQS